MNNFNLTDKNPRFFYDAADFGFLKPLTDNFAEIRQELHDLINVKKEDQWLRTFPTYVKSDTYKAWKVFSFIFFNMKFPENAKLCPKTAELVYSIPEILSCDYSYLDANSHILPHKGYSRMVLRCHLPLVVPDVEQCALRVGDQVRHWKEGELMIFDDSFDHEAWNRTNEKRIVLMFDIPNPLWGYTAYEISKYKIEHIDDPFLLNMASKERWQEAFKEGVYPLKRFVD